MKNPDVGIGVGVAGLFGGQAVKQVTHFLHQKERVQLESQ